MKYCLNTVALVVILSLVVIESNRKNQRSNAHVRRRQFIIRCCGRKSCLRPGPEKSRKTTTSLSTKDESDEFLLTDAMSSVENYQPNTPTKSQLSKLTTIEQVSSTGSGNNNYFPNGQFVSNKPIGQNNVNYSQDSQSMIDPAGQFMTSTLSKSGEQNAVSAVTTDKLQNQITTIAPEINNQQMVTSSINNAPTSVSAINNQQKLTIVVSSAADSSQISSTLAYPANNQNALNSAGQTVTLNTLITSGLSTNNDNANSINTQSSGASNLNPTLQSELPVSVVNTAGATASVGSVGNQVPSTLAPTINAESTNTISVTTLDPNIIPTNLAVTNTNAPTTISENPMMTSQPLDPAAVTTLQNIATSSVGTQISDRPSMPATSTDSLATSDSGVNSTLTAEDTPKATTEKSTVKSAESAQVNTTEGVEVAISTETPLTTVEVTQIITSPLTTVTKKPYYTVFGPAMTPAMPVPSTTFPPRIPCPDMCNTTTPPITGTNNEATTTPPNIMLEVDGGLSSEHVSGKWVFICDKPITPGLETNLIPVFPEVNASSPGLCCSYCLKVVEHSTGIQHNISAVMANAAISQDTNENIELTYETSEVAGNTSVIQTGTYNGTVDNVKKCDPAVPLKKADGSTGAGCDVINPIDPSTNNVIVTETTFYTTSNDASVPNLSGNLLPVYTEGTWTTIIDKSSYTGVLFTSVSNTDGSWKVYMCRVASSTDSTNKFPCWGINYNSQWGSECYYPDLSKTQIYVFGGSFECLQSTTSQVKWVLFSVNHEIPSNAVRAGYTSNTIGSQVVNFVGRPSVTILHGLIGRIPQDTKTLLVISAETCFEYQTYELLVWA